MDVHCYSPDPLDGGYIPPLSLWCLIEQHVSEHERDEIRNMLGDGLIEQTIELHQEVEILLEIWRDCRKGQETSVHRLPEPPGMRDRLIQEIHFFIENVREKAQLQGRDEPEVLSRCDKKVIDYALTGGRSSSIDNFRPASALGHDGRETPLIRFESPASDRNSLSSQSTLSEEVDSMSEKLNILKLDEVSNHLRSYLHDEKQRLVQDLSFLQSCIEEENEAEEKAVEPSINELREHRIKLEKEMLSDVFKTHQILTTDKIVNKIRHPMNRAEIIPKSGPIRAVHVSEPDGIVLKGNAPDSLIHKTQQQLFEQSKTKTETIARPLHSGRANPPVPKPVVARPSSARRFRSMILSSRDCGEE